MMDDEKSQYKLNEIDRFDNKEEPILNLPFCENNKDANAAVHDYGCVKKKFLKIAMIILTTVCNNIHVEEENKNVRKYLSKMEN